MYWEDYFEARDEDSIKEIDEHLSGKNKNEGPKSDLAQRLEKQRKEKGKNARREAEENILKAKEINKGQAK